MTDYITPIGVQHFSITIPPGNATATATINAVGARAFILMGGLNPSGSVQSESLAYLSLTNPTTITATRRLSSASVVIKGCIIDATENLVASVQYGTITLPDGTASATATISPVNNNNTAVHALGMATDANGSFAENNAFLSLSGTTLTATVLGAYGLFIASYCVIEFASAALNQNVQNLAINSSASTTSITSTINSVDIDNTICIAGGTTCNSGSYSNGQIYGFLSNSTTFALAINSASTARKQYNVSIVELKTDILQSAVKRNRTSLSGVNLNTSTISSVMKASSVISWLNNSTNSPSSIGEATGAAVLTNGTTVTVSRNNSSNNILGSWEVAEFPPSKQAYSTGLSTGTATVIGKSGAGAAGVSLGASAVSGTAITASISVGTAAGVASASAVSTAGSFGIADGVSIVAGRSALTVSSVGSSFGQATVSGVGGNGTFGVGMAIGVATVSAMGTQATYATGVAIGSAVVSGRTNAIARSAGTAIGTSTATAQGNAAPQPPFPLPPTEYPIDVLIPVELPIAA